MGFHAPRAEWRGRTFREVHHGPNGRRSLRRGNRAGKNAQGPRQIAVFTHVSGAGIGRWSLTAKAVAATGEFDVDENASRKVESG